MSTKDSLEKEDVAVADREVEPFVRPKRPLSKRILAVIWDSLDKTPEERAFIAKIDCS
jgi:MFS transporter, ACS family, pantothenate transporter